MKRSLFTLTMLLGCLLSITAQTNPRPGYIITLTNDTIHGTIDYRTAMQNATKCTFYRAGEEEATTYSPNDIYAYRFEDNGKYYVSRTIKLADKEEKYFLEYLINGVVSLYYLSQLTEEYYLFEDENGEMNISKVVSLTNLDNEETIEKRREILTPIFHVFRNSSTITKKLWNSKISKNNLTQLTKEYHEEFCTSADECIQYEYDEKKEGLLKVKIILSAGVSIATFDSWEFQQGIGKFNATVPHLRIAADFYMPRISNKLMVQPAINIGKWKMSNDDKEIDATSCDLQLGLGYKLIDSKFAPIIRAGLTSTSFFSMDSNFDSSTVIGINEGVNFYTGYFVGASFEYKIKKGAIVANVSYQNRDGNEKYMKSFDISLGYRF